jgi:hypothetical protein
MTGSPAALAAKMVRDSTPNGRKRGRPQDPHLSLYRSLFQDWSPRTIARYRRACQLLEEASVGEDEHQAIITSLLRPNGSFSVAAFERRAVQVWWERLISPRVEAAER